MSVFLLEARFRGEVFFRLGYYVYHEYEEEGMRENPPREVVWEKVRRVVVAGRPVVTRPMIDWEGKEGGSGYLRREGSNEGVEQRIYSWGYEEVLNSWGRVEMSAELQKELQKYLENRVSKISIEFEGEEEEKGNGSEGQDGDG